MLRRGAALQEGCEFETDDRGVTVCDPVSPGGLLAGKT